MISLKYALLLVLMPNFSEGQTLNITSPLEGCLGNSLIFECTTDMVSLSDITIKSFGQRFMDERVQSFSNGSHKIVNRLSPLQLIDDGRELQCCLDSPTLVSDSARINVIASCQVNISVNPFESFDGQSLEIIRFVTPTMSPGFITLRRDGAEFMDTIRLTNETHVMFALDPLMLSDNGTAFQCIFEAYSSEEVVITVQPIIYELLDNPSNGTITYSNGTSGGSVATHSCDDDYLLVGNETRTCTADQMRAFWTGTAPFCREIPTSTPVNPILSREAIIGIGTAGSIITISIVIFIIIIASFSNRCSSSDDRAKTSQDPEEVPKTSQADLASREVSCSLPSDFTSMKTPQLPGTKQKRLSSYPLYVKCDPAITSKSLDENLSLILRTNLLYSGQQRGLYVFKFLNSDLKFDALFPLRTEQELMLLKARIRWLRCGDRMYDSEEIRRKHFDPKEQYPFLQPLETLSFDHNGARYRNERMGVMIEIPKGAIKEGLTVKIELGIALHGPFSYPTNIHPISPILFLCPQKEIQLLHPIKIVLPHIMQDDPEVILLKSHHSDYNGEKSVHHFKRLESKTKVLSLKHKKVNYCYFSLDHFCFVCIGRIDEQTARNFGYSLTCVKPKVCKNSLNEIYIYVSFNMPPCKERLKHHYSEDEYDHLHLENFTQEDLFNNDEYIQLTKIDCSNEAVITKRPHKIPLKDVEFWNEDERELIESLDKQKQHPPRMQMEISPKSQHECPLTAEFKFNLNKNENQPYPVLLICAEHVRGSTQLTPNMQKNEVMTNWRKENALFPLSTEQKQMLSEARIQQLQCGDYTYDSVCEEECRLHLESPQPSKVTSPHLDFMPSSDDIIRDTSQHTAIQKQLSSTTPRPLSPYPRLSTHSLYIKSSAIASKSLEEKLSLILSTELFYSGQQHGLYVFKFLNSDLNFDALFPLSTEQKQMLSEAGIQQLQCGDYSYDSVHKEECRLHLESPQLASKVTSPHLDFKSSSDNVFKDTATEPSFEKVTNKVDILYDPEEHGNIPFLQPLETLSFDHNGARYRNESMGVMIEIPKGAIEEGLTVDIKVGIALHGPFSYPTKMHPISPILFLCPQKEVQLLHPIKIVLPHIMQDDPEVILLKSHHSDYNGKKSVHHFKPLECKTKVSLFKHKKVNYCHFSLDHFCFVCIGEIDEQTARNIGYSLTCVKPKVCKNSPDEIYIYVSFNMPPCKQRLKDHYSKDEYDHLHLEDFTPEDLLNNDEEDLLNNDECIRLTGIDCSSEAVITEHPHNKIPLKKVEFWNEDERELIKSLDEQKRHPPRMQMEISPKSQHECPLIAKFKFNLKETQPYPIQLICAEHVHGSTQLSPNTHGNEAMTKSNWRKENLAFRHFQLLRIKDNDGKVHKFKIFDAICSKWKGIAALLDLYQLVRKFEDKHMKSSYDCCYDIFTEWFIRGSDQYPPTWDGFLKLLCDLELFALQRAIKEGTIID